MNIDIIPESETLDYIPWGSPFTVVNCEKYTSVYLRTNHDGTMWPEKSGHHTVVDLECGRVCYMPADMRVIRRECKGFV